MTLIERCIGLVCALSLRGCAARQWAKPIGDFKQSVDASLLAVIGEDGQEG